MDARPTGEALSPRYHDLFPNTVAIWAFRCRPQSGWSRSARPNGSCGSAQQARPGPRRPCDRAAAADAAEPARGSLVTSCGSGLSSAAPGSQLPGLPGPRPRHQSQNALARQKSHVYNARHASGDACNPVIIRQATAAFYGITHVTQSGAPENVSERPLGVTITVRPSLKFPQLSNSMSRQRAGCL